MKVYVVGPWFESTVGEMFKHFGWEITKKLKEADLIQFTGGADINPAIYGKLKHNTVHFQPERDRAELLIYHAALELNKPMAGICRGAQFLCAMGGGTLWQNVNGHNGRDHPVTDDMTGEIFITNSLHHQMMIPSNDAVVIAFAKEATMKSTRDDDGNERTMHYISKALSGGDPEVVVQWVGKKSVPLLGIQGHPEFRPNGHELQKRYFKYVKEYIFSDHPPKEPATVAKVA